MTEVNGVVSEALPNTQFRVTLEDGREILAHLAGKMRLYRIRVMPGDKVKLEMSPYDTDKGKSLTGKVDPFSPSVCSIIQKLFINLKTKHACAFNRQSDPDAKTAKLLNATGRCSLFASTHATNSVKDN